MIEHRFERTGDRPHDDEDAGRRGRRGRGGWLLPLGLGAVLVAAGVGLAAWKTKSIRAADAAAASQPEPAEVVTVVEAVPREVRRTVTAIGTVLAIRSVTLRNELAGTVALVNLTPGATVEPGAVLVRLDTAVEEAELKAQKAQAKLAGTILERNREASENDAVSAVEVDRARAELEVAEAAIERTEAVIRRKTIRAPFRARVGLADVHRGQYLDEGTVLTTLQGIDDAAHVDFSVAQAVAAGLGEGETVQVTVAGQPGPIAGTIVARDARVDASTRNSLVRARIAAGATLAPGAAARVEVPEGPPVRGVAVPVTALRKGPEGDHVFVIAAGSDGKTRARRRAVQAAAVVGNEVLIVEGLTPGEEVAASGSFKLRDAALVQVATAGKEGA